MADLLHIAEPELTFGFDQTAEDPRDGLSLFGPLDSGKPYGIRMGLIGTKDSVRRFKEWISRIQGLVEDATESPARPIFPGFESVFGIPWSSVPTAEVIVANDELTRTIHIDDKYVRVYRTVELFASRIIESTRDEDTSVDVWFVVIPDDVYKYGRPMSTVEPEKRVRSERLLTRGYARALLNQASMFAEDERHAQPYYYDVHFHNQLKARLLEHGIPTQVVRESTIAHREFVDRFGSPIRKLDNSQAAIAWTISTAAFYKSGGRPWKLAEVRPGVCYIGLAFKKDEQSTDPRFACAAAQMFLDSGDGVVFRGAVGPWYNPDTGQYHMTASGAEELVAMACEAYADRTGSPPSELFIHGKVAFNDQEWAGFTAGVGTTTNLVGVRMRTTNDLKLYRKGDYPALRGLAHVVDERTAFLWTSGYIPRLQTYPGREVPRPLLVDVCKGEADMPTVLADILALTKFNYNSCIFGDGIPVTLRFADSVGEILTAGPIGKVPPLAFKHYI